MAEQIRISHQTKTKLDEMKAEEGHMSYDSAIRALFHEKELRQQENRK